MQHKTKSSVNIPPPPLPVQFFSSLVEMRFKPSTEQGSKTLEKKRQKLIKKNKEAIDLYDPITMAFQIDHSSLLNQNRRLKFLANLSPEHFIIGNQNQIDMVGFGSMAHSYVQTDYYWSLSLQGPIQGISVDSKKCIFIILSEMNLYFYEYSIKSREVPSVINTVQVKEGVRFVRFLKDQLLGIFYSENYEIYNIESIKTIKKKLEKTYPVNKQKKLLTIPTSIDSIINVFFQEPKDKKQSFILWCLQINFGSQKIKTKQPYRVYDVMNHAKDKLSIQNYTTDIIFLGINHQIMAIKNGYLIDNVNLRVEDQSQILKYIHPNTLLHINKKHVEVYNFAIDFNAKPEKIVLRTIDSIELSKIPNQAIYMSVLKTFPNNLAIFFQDSIKKRFQTRGEISYYFQLSQNTTVQDKMDTLFDDIEAHINNPEFVSQKYRVALKMGLTQKQIYLQIWNRSNKTSLEDYQYILSTKEYKIIKNEIEKKLKKESMVLRQVIRIQESCHEINRQLIDSPECTQQNLKDYVTSHFFLKKLKIYKDISSLDRLSIIENSNFDSHEAHGKQLKIDVHNYFHYKNVDIKTLLIQLISDMLFNLKNNAKIIRMVIRKFNFIFRLQYKCILDEIIINAKQNLIDLLNQLPQILLFRHDDLNEDEKKQGLYGGIWGQIDNQHWDNQLYPAALTTIYNKETIHNFMKSIWFKRNWMTNHGVTTKNKQEIQIINEFNNSDKIFYFFISKLYDHLKHNKPLYYQTVQFLQEKYPTYPAHLKGKAPLYQNLYIYYFNEEQGCGRVNFSDFLEWDDELLFKYFFDHQKVKKNSILKQIKPIYQQSDPNGPHLFNIGLFSYFYSDISQISDLKYILNRLNNQKAEFHQKNRGIYQVLIKSVQFKIHLGTGNDIPMDEVMVYIQNILLDDNDKILDQLCIMQSIKDQTKLFKQIKINMTIKEIMDHFELVQQKIVEYKINALDILKIQTNEQFRDESIKILKEALRIKGRIHSQQQSQYILLLYLSIVLQHQQNIELVATFIDNQQLHEMFQISTLIVENIVMYMFKWSFSQSSFYSHNQNYIRKLLQLLPSDNQCRHYLETQLQIGLLLSSEEDSFEYPLCKHSYYPTSKVITQTFKYKSSEFLLALDLNKFSQLLTQLESCVYGNKPVPQPLSLHKLYEIMIVDLLQKKKYKEVLSYIGKIFQVEGANKNMGIIYVAIYIYKTAKEFNQDSKKILLKLLALYFNQPQELIKILDFSIKTSLTGLQQSQYLRSIIQQQSSRSNFNPKNPILNSQFTSHHQDPNSQTVIETYRQFLKSKNQQFDRQSEYDIIFTFLCQSPYMLIKFIQLEKDNINYKFLAAFLTMTVSRPIFNRLTSYEVLKRIFTALTMSSKDNKNIDELISLFEVKSIHQEFKLVKIPKLNDYEQKVYKLAKMMVKLLSKYSKMQAKEQVKDKSLLQIKTALSNPNQVYMEEFQNVQQENQIDVNNNMDEMRGRTKKGCIKFKDYIEKQTYFYRFTSLVDFLQDKSSGNIQKRISLSLVKKQSAPLLLKGMKSTKDQKYLQTKNQAIQHLYSHKVLVGSQYQDDQATRRQDESFLDSFLPKPQIDIEKVSLASIRNSGSIRKSRSKEIKFDGNNKKQGQNVRILDLIDNEVIEPIELKATSYINIIEKQPQAKTENFQNLRQNLVKTYNQTKIPKFDLAALDKQLKQLKESAEEDKKQEYINSFFKHLYSQHLSSALINLKLMEEIARKNPDIGVNIFFLQAYQRTYTTHEKLGLEMNITDFLPLTGIYVKSKDIFDLYLEIQPIIVKHITDENIFKLSKLIALGFRKSIVEQQILVRYMNLLMETYVNIPQEDLTNQMEKIRTILLKLQPQILIDKAQELFNALNFGERRTTIFEMYMQFLKNRGYGTASRQLRSKII